MRTRQGQPFQLTGRWTWGRFRALNTLSAHVLEQLFGLKKLGSLYAALPKGLDVRDFLRQVFASLDVAYHVPRQELARIPRSGPAIVIANHPFGAIDGLIMADVLKSVRPDCKIMANHFLHGIPELADLFLDVDPFGGKQAMARNIPALRKALRWVEAGGLLMLFPAGEVAHRRLPGWSPATDSKWSRTLSRIVKTTKASVIPCFFHGSNSALFHTLGLVHPLLRTAMLPRELLRKRGSHIAMNIGEPIPCKRIAGYADDEVLDYLRFRTYLLKNTPKETGQADREDRKHAYRSLDAIVAVTDADKMQQEVSALPDSQCLLNNTPFAVYYANAQQIPCLLREIGRLREVTFRGAGEGTGKSIDIDHYDNNYLHLFVWQVKTGELIGAYRMGLSDLIMREHGIAGLYSFSLFEYQTTFMEELSPAIELGRSFVRDEYQRSFAPLMLLWKGIAEFVVRHPRYRRLFGPVSLSSEYHTLSQAFLVAFLLKHECLPGLASLVTPRHPYQPSDKVIGQFHNLIRNPDIDRISRLMADIEADRKGVPVLIKQYLKLGGKLLGFNVDPDFGNVIDGLIMVDLLQTDRRVLQKYMGKQGMDCFINYHAENHDPETQASLNIG